MKLRTLSTGLAASTVLLLTGCGGTVDQDAPSSRSTSLQWLAEAAAPDVIPTARLELAGDIALRFGAAESEPVDPDDRDARGNVRAYRFACAATCAALLAMPRVTSVTVIAPDQDGKDSEQSRTFRLVPRSQCPMVVVLPDHPDQLGVGQPGYSREPLARTPEDVQMRERRELARSVENWETWWKVQLSTRVCLRAEPARQRFDIVIRKQDGAYPANYSPQFDPCTSTSALPVHYATVDITDASGKVRYRRTNATTMAVSDPPKRGVCGFKHVIWPKWGWTRSMVERGKDFSTDQALADATDLRVRPDVTDLGSAVGDVFRKALANPRLQAIDPAFALSEEYFNLLAALGISSQDRETLVATIRDERVTKFGGFYRVVRALGPESGFLRQPIVERAARGGTDVAAAQELSSLLPNLPVTPLSADEQRLLANPAQRSQSPVLIRSAADNGQVSNAQLLLWLKQHIERLDQAQAIGGTGEVAAIGAIRQALCRRGTAANDVLVPLLTMQQTRRLPPAIYEARDWQIMLARLGRPIGQFSPEMRELLDQDKPGRSGDCLN